MAASEAPDWFYDTVASGLQALVALSLPRQPPAETIALTLDVWVQTLWRAPISWDETIDKRRIDYAFASLARLVDQWPAPKHLLRELPNRPEQLRPRLESAPISDEKRAKYFELLDEMLKRLGVRRERQ